MASLNQPFVEVAKWAMELKRSPSVSAPSPEGRLPEKAEGASEARKQDDGQLVLKKYSRNSLQDLAGSCTDKMPAHIHWPFSAYLYNCSLGTFFKKVKIIRVVQKSKDISACGLSLDDQEYGAET